MAQFLVIGDPNDLHTRLRIDYLRQRGHSVELLCEKTEMQRMHQREGQCPWVHPVDLPYFSWKNAKQRRTGAALIEERIGQTGAQLLLILYGEPHVGWAFYQRRWNIPIALHTYGTDALVTLPRITQMGWMAPVRKMLFRRAFQGVHLHLASSRKQFETLAHLTPAHVQKELVRIGLKSAALEQFKQEQWASPMPGPYIIFPRMMHPIYNHEACVEAIALLPDDIRRGHAFVFVDADSRYTTYTEQLRQKMGKQSDVQYEWLPRLDALQLWNWIQHAALCVQIPNTDASAMTALETLYLGTPLLLGPAAYDDDLYAGVPRTRVVAKEIAECITRLIASPLPPRTDISTLRQLTDVELQCVAMEKHLLALIERQERTYK